MRRDSSRLRWSGPRPGPIASTVTEHHRSLGDRKSTRLNSSHSQISYAVFCLKKKKNKSYTFANIQQHPMYLNQIRFTPSKRQRDCQHVNVKPKTVDHYIYHPDLGFEYLLLQ